MDSSHNPSAKERVPWRILIVDDNPVNRKLVAAVLKNTAQCDMASNGKEALEAYKDALRENRPYHLLLLDVAMPEIDGLQVLQRIREDEKSREIPAGKGVIIIMITAHTEPVFSAYNAGCDDYILKPLRPDILLEKIIQKLSAREI